MSEADWEVFERCVFFIVLFEIVEMLLKKGVYIIEQGNMFGILDTAAN